MKVMDSFSASIIILMADIILFHDCSLVFIHKTFSTAHQKVKKKEPRGLGVQESGRDQHYDTLVSVKIDVNFFCR